MRKFSRLFKKKSKVFEFFPAPNITRRIRHLLHECSLDYMDPERVFCVESTGSKSRAYARMWGLPRIWQTALKTGPAYILEVTHKFQKLSQPEQDKVLFHELAHIPKNFSGALVGHHGIEKRIQMMMKKRKDK